MPSGTIYALRDLQIGKEAAWGTAVAATHQLYATAEMTALYPLHRSPTPLGVLVKNPGPTPLLSKGADIRLSMPEVTYEQILWLLAMGIDTPVAAGVGPYTHTLDPGVAALWAPTSTTIEARWTDGTTPEEIEIEGCLARRLTLSGEMGGVCSLEADIFGKQVTDAAITAISAPTALDVMRVADCKVWINDTWALADVEPPVANQFTAQVIRFSLEIDTGLQPFQGIDGALTPSDYKEVAKDLRFTMTCLFDPSAAASATEERGHAQSQADRFVTLTFIGTTNNQAYFAFTGRHEMGDFVTIGEQDGLDVVEMTILGQYEATGAKLIKGVVTNDLATWDA